MAHLRSVPPKLSLPPHYSSLTSNSNSSKTTPRFYPDFALTPKTQWKNNAFLFSPSLTPTPSKRVRAPEGPLWMFTLLHLFSLYALHRWQQQRSVAAPLSLVTFFPLLFSAVFLGIIYRPWKGQPIGPPSQWGFVFATGAILALSTALRFAGLQLCGPLETVYADFSGSLVAKVVIDHFFVKKFSSRPTVLRKAYSITAVMAGMFLLSHGWARADCSPIAFDITYQTRVRIIEQQTDCANASWQIFVPFLGGILSVLQRNVGSRAALRSIGKKRIQVISYAVASMILVPFASWQGALLVEKSPLRDASIACIVGFGMVIAFFSDFYCEEKILIPVHSMRAFQIIGCCVCGLELLYGLHISLVGFMFCSIVLGIGIRELSLLQGQLTWEVVGGSTQGSLIHASGIKRTLQHIMSDKKSRKIAIFLLMNAAFMVVEFFYGFLRNSLGLISDACHMLFDCAALAIGLYASYISRLPENSKYNYGYGRFEVVSGYANAVLLVLVASLIVLESVERILEPPEISTESLLVVSLGGLLVNIVGLIFFHEEHHQAHGQTCSLSHSGHELHSNSPKVSLSTISCDDQCQHSHPGNEVHHHQQLTESSGREVDMKNDHIHVPRSHEHVHQRDVCDNHQDECSHRTDHNCSSHQHHHEYHNHQPHDNDQNNHNHTHFQDLNIKRDHLDDHKHDSSQHHERYNQHQHQHGHHLDLCDGDVAHDHSHEHLHNDHHHDDNHHHNLNIDHRHHRNGHHDHDHQHNHNHNHDHDHQHNHDHQHDHVHHHDHDHHEHDHGHDHNHHHMDHNMYGLFLHVLADTLGSVGVVISTLLIKYKGWLITDPACSIVLSVLIISSVIPLLRNSAEILLQRVPRHNDNAVKKVMVKVSKMPGIRNVGRMHVWSFTNTAVVGSIHIQISTGVKKKSLQEQILRLLHGAGIGDVTLQIEEV